MGTEVDNELVNDTYMTKRWFAHARNEYGDPVIRPDYHIPGLMVPILPEQYKTVVVDLSKPTNKHARNDIAKAKREGYRVVEVGPTDMSGLAFDVGKACGKNIMQAQRIFLSMHDAGYKFYAGYDDIEVVGGLTLLVGEDWLTMRFAFGKLDPIIGHIIEEHNKSYKFFDLGGLNTTQNSQWWKFWRNKKKEADINKFKEKWGEVKTVFLRMD